LQRPGVHDSPNGVQPPARRYALAELFGDRGHQLVEHIPHCRRLGMDVVRTGPCEAVRLHYREELIGDPVRRVVFGGVITTLLDHAGGLAVFCSLEELKAIATLDLRIDYLRAAEPGIDLLGTATCYKLTTSVAFVRAIAYERDPDEPFACALGTFMVGANPTESPMARALRQKMEGA
jgi:uncharacterized protein (TIGR00369 family)